ncbi:2836_t:CDS:2 [Racocetra fulgida]|uniref:2836_t:CDS:1 n=1 Tax=Racocetra fulgida TaxID=60492 RepID=A0A9N8VKZ9_9GLOM|nr:2836_t:CDS:2 [Racocetra fulgida]
MSNEYLDNMVLDDTNIGGSEFSSTENGSSVKLFFKTESIDNTEFWACRHKVCKVKYIKDGSTSNLWRHMRGKHHILKAMIESGRVKIITKDNDKCEFSVISESSQPTIIQAFKKIIEELDVQANVLSIDRLKKLFINSKDKILKNVHEYAINNTEISSVSFTTDMWTSDNGDPYIGLTLYWINDNFQIKEIIGNISYFSYPHTADCLLNKIVKILDSLNLKNITVCVEANDNNLLKNYEEKELLSNDWDKVTELVKLLHPYEIVSKKLSDMPIFTEDERSCTILEACVEFELISNSYKLDTSSDTENQIDLTLSCDKINDEDTFALPTDTSSQEQSSYQDSINPCSQVLNHSGNISAIERLLSSAGLTITDNRTRLDP